MADKSSTKIDKKKKGVKPKHSVSGKNVSSKSKVKKVNDKKESSAKLNKKEVSKSVKTVKEKKVRQKDKVSSSEAENTSKAKKSGLEKKIINKTSITYLGLILFDVLLTIYIARQNIINYVVIVDKKVMMSKLSYLLLGRNYVNVVLMLFFYGYTCLVNKFFLKRKNSIKFLILLLVVVVCINLLLFYLFSNKVY